MTYRITMSNLFENRSGQQIYTMYTKNSENSLKLPDMYTKGFTIQVGLFSLRLLLPNGFAHIFLQNTKLST